MINIGVVGSGGIIAKHIGHLADRTDARIVALCDVNPEMIQARQEAFFEDRQVNGYATPEEMYALLPRRIRCITVRRFRRWKQAAMCFLKNR
jgi:predicted dehydrogenase